MNTKLQQLKQELARVRRASLDATRQNDFLRVANLTVKAAQLNRAINQVEEQMEVDSM
jgi:hypothetical protein